MTGTKLLSSCVYVILWMDWRIDLGYTDRLDEIPGPANGRSWLWDNEH